MIPVLVIGGAGYVGSHTCKRLKQKGYIPVVFDNLKNSKVSAVRYGPFVKGNLLDPSALDHAFATYQPKAVLHFASLIDARASMKEPGTYYQNNVQGSLALLQAMQRHSVPLLVFSSSAAVYGLPQQEIVSESHSCNPINVYGWTKLMTERMIHDFGKAGELRSVIFRYFNASGADPDQELGEAHDPETHLIPLALRAALKKEEGLYIFGNDHATADGTPIRDYVHVTDLAEAHVKALEWLLAGENSITVNLGAGKGHSVFEVLKVVEKVSKKKISYELMPKNLADPPTLIADIRLASSLLQWTPSHSNLETIISTAHKWHLKDLS